MRTPNLHDLQQLILDWNKHIGRAIWGKIWFDGLDYCVTIYHVIYGDVVGNLMSFNVFNPNTWEKISSSISMRNLVLQVLKWCRMIKEDWDMFGKRFDEVVDFRMVWNKEERSLGVGNQVWEATIHFERLMFYVLLLLFVTKGSQVVVLIVSSVISWWENPRKRRLSVELAEPMSFRLSDPDGSQRVEVLFKNDEGKTNNEKELDRAAWTHVGQGKVAHIEKFTNNIPTSRVGKMLPPALPHRIPTIRFADEPLIGDFVANLDTGINQSFAILNDSHELDSTMSTVDDGEHNSAGYLYGQVSSRNSECGQEHDENVYTTQRFIRRQSQMNLQRLITDGTSYKPNLPDNLARAEIPHERYLTNSDAGFSDASTVLLPEVFENNPHPLYYVLDEAGNLTHQTPIMDARDNVDEPDQKSDTVANLSRQLDESINIGPLWSSPFKGMGATIRPKPNLDSHVIPDISPLDLSPSHDDGVHHSSKKRDSISEDWTEDDAGEESGSEEEVLMLDLIPRASKRVLNTQSSVPDQNCDAQCTINPVIPDSSPDVDQRIEKLLGRLSEINEDSQISSSHTNPLKDELLDEFTQNSLAGHNEVPETDTEGFWSSPDEQDMTEEEMGLFGLPTASPERLELPKAILDNSDVMDEGDEGAAREIYNEAGSEQAGIRSTSHTEISSEAKTGSKTEQDRLQAQDIDEDESDQLNSNQSYEDESSNAFELPPNYIEDYHSDIVHSLGRRGAFAAPSAVEEPIPKESEDSEFGASILDDSSMNESFLINSDMVKGKTPESSLQRLGIAPRELMSRSKYECPSSPLIGKPPAQRTASTFWTLPSESSINRHSRTLSSSDIITDVHSLVSSRARSVSPVKSRAGEVVRSRNMLGNASPSMIYKRMSQRQTPGSQLFENTPPERPRMSSTGESVSKSGKEFSRIPRPPHRE